MRYWNTPLHTKRTGTERAVRRFIDCTPSYYRFWAVADKTTDLCLGLVSYHDGHIRNKRVAIGYMVDPAHCKQGLATEAVSAMIRFCFQDLGLHRLQAFIHPDNTPSLKRSKSSDSVAKVCCAKTCASATNGATTCFTRCSQLTIRPKPGRSDALDFGFRTEPGRRAFVFAHLLRSAPRAPEARCDRGAPSIRFLGSTCFARRNQSRPISFKPS